MHPLELFLADARDGDPLLAEGLPASALASTDRLARGPASYRMADGDPNSLYEQGWGVVAPEGPRGDALLEAVAPLIQRRAAQQELDVRVLRAPAGLEGPEARAWVAAHFDDPTLDAIDIPRYVMLLGDLHEVSFDVQRVLAEDALVGRLAFDGDAQYAAYAEKLLRWEAAPAPGQGRALFVTARDGTRATELAHRALITPSLRDARAAVEAYAPGDRRHPFPAARVEDLALEGPTPPERLLGATRSDAPTLLFSVSHGAGTPRRGWASEDERRALQGALCLGGGEQLTAEAVGAGDFLPGGLWAFFACYGAGTPPRSAFWHWLERLKEQGGFGGRAASVLKGLPEPGQRPFVASLPKAALANPRGPLAVLGHLDLAWSYSFQELGERTVDRYKRWGPVLGALVAGSRAGTALHELLRPAADADRETSDLLDLAERARREGAEAGDEAVFEGNRWMTRQDLGGYVLLGDPAAHLPVTAARAAPEGPAPAQAATPEVRTAAPAQETPRAAPPPPDAARVEAAVLDALLAERLAGPGALAGVAARHGLEAEALARWVEAWRAAGRRALGLPC